MFKFSLSNQKKYWVKKQWRSFSSFEFHFNCCCDVCEYFYRVNYFLFKLKIFIDVSLWTLLKLCIKCKIVLTIKENFNYNIVAVLKCQDLSDNGKIDRNKTRFKDLTIEYVSSSFHTGILKVHISLILSCFIMIQPKCEDYFVIANNPWKDYHWWDCLTKFLLSHLSSSH